MKRLLMVILLSAPAQLILAQQEYFLYLQTENAQPFYIQFEGKTISSTPAGYTIISRLKDTVYSFTLGFPRNIYPEQRFKLNINKTDGGYLLKNLGEKGWALFNMHTLELLMPVLQNNNAKTYLQGEKKTDAFSVLMANVVNDSTILYANNKPTQYGKQAIAITNTEVVFNGTDADSLKKKDVIQLSVKTNNDSIIETKKDTLALATSQQPAATDTSNLNLPQLKDSLTLKVKDTFALAATQIPIKTDTLAIAFAEKKDSLLITKKDTLTVTQPAPTFKSDTLTITQPSPIIKNDTLTIMQAAPMFKSDTLTYKPENPDSLVQTKTDTVVAIENMQPKKNTLALADTLTKADTLYAKKTIITDSVFLQGKKDTVSLITMPQPAAIDTTTKKILNPAEPVMKEPLLNKDTTSKIRVVTTNTKPEVLKIAEYFSNNIYKYSYAVNDSSKTDTVTVEIIAEPAVYKKDTELIQVAPLKNDTIKTIADTIKKPRLLIPNSDCRIIASENDIDKLRIKILGIKTASDKLNEANKFMKKKCFYVNQLVSLSELFEADENKYQFFEAAYPHTYDTYYFDKLIDYLNMEANKTKLKTLLRR
jgi:Domain of unknown function (DUF4476)